MLRLSGSASLPVQAKAAPTARRACSRSRARPGQPPLRFVANTVRAHHLPPSWLQLEITETALVTEPQETSAKFVELKALGVALAIDDFGTGHASLSYLHQFPVDVVKIDQSFTASLGSGGRADSVSRAVIQLTHNLDMKAVAEGVEAAHQVHQLGCHFAQGHHFSPGRGNRPNLSFGVGRLAFEAALGVLGCRFRGI
jgi:EAL domain-containing protein (putative c-di-GMP-specific phosphodiesterase class I)